MEPISAVKFVESAIKALGSSWRWLLILRVNSVWKAEQTRYSELFNATVKCQEAFRKLDRNSRAFRAPLGIESPGTEEELQAAGLLRFYLADLDHALIEYQWPAEVIEKLSLIFLCRAWHIPANAQLVDSSEVSVVMRVNGPFDGVQCLEKLPCHEATLRWMIDRGRFSDRDRKLNVFHRWKVLPPDPRPRPRESSLAESLETERRALPDSGS